MRKKVYNKYYKKGVKPTLSKSDKTKMRKAYQQIKRMAKLFRKYR